MNKISSDLADGQIKEENGFLVEMRYDDRMVIMTPIRADSNYSQPDYTFVFANGMCELATDYKYMYLNPD